jgi:hypothetical protein
MTVCWVQVVGDSWAAALAQVVEKTGMDTKSPRASVYRSFDRIVVEGYLRSRDREARNMTGPVYKTVETTGSRRHLPSFRSHTG